MGDFLCALNGEPARIEREIGIVDHIFRLDFDALERQKFETRSNFSNASFASARPTP